MKAKAIMEAKVVNLRFTKISKSLCDERTGGGDIAQARALLPLT